VNHSVSTAAGTTTVRYGRRIVSMHALEWHHWAPTPLLRRRMLRRRRRVQRLPLGVIGQLEAIFDREVRPLTPAQRRDRGLA